MRRRCACSRASMCSAARNEGQKNRRFDHTHIVYVGRTAPRSNLRTELEHALTMAMAEDLTATHFTYELTATPKTRAAEELRDYYERWGSLPRYNEARAAYDEGAVFRAGREA